MLFHSWPKPDTLTYYDATLTEIYINRPWKHSLWKFGELANYSNIFPIPTLFNIYLHDHGTEAEARTKMIQGLANGCFPNFWNILGMKPFFRFVEENAECFDFLRTSPTPFLAFPRGVRVDSAQQRISNNTKADKKPKNNRFLAPYVGFYSAIMRQGIPVVTLQRTDFHKQLERFKVLCLANEACLSDEQVEAIRGFVKNGGALIATHETSLYDNKGNQRPDFGLADVFGVQYEQMLPASNRQIHIETPHPVTQGLTASKPLSHDDTHVDVKLTAGESVATLKGKDLQGKSIPAVVVNQYGAGRVVYLPGRLDAIQCEVLSANVEQLFSNAVQWVVNGEVPVKLRAPATIGVTLFDQPNRRLLHLVNLNGNTQFKSDTIQPIENIEIQLSPPRGRHIRQLRRLWNKSDIDFQVNKNKINFKLAKLQEYEVISAELEKKETDRLQ